MVHEIDTTSLAVVAPAHASWISAASRTMFDALRAQPPAPAGPVEAQRAHYDAINSARLQRALLRYPVTVSESELGGIRVHDIVPDQRNPTLSSATLVCLHGGAFIWGAGAGAILEAVPVAAMTGIRVVAVEYRLAPEHVYPAAVEDVLAVVAALRELSGGRIGMYGCSAGAVLTAQATARLLTEGEPVPDAIAMLHGSGVEVGGDSLALAGQLNGSPSAADIQRMHDLSYFTGSDPADPLVFPGDHPGLLAGFPPSLLITGTRDFAASGVSVMHRRLAAAGVDARLFLFDGMWHAHHVDVDLPEAEEAHAILSEFFVRQLSAA